MTNKSSMHLWRGKRIAYDEIYSRLMNLNAEVGSTISMPLQIDDVLNACESLSQRILLQSPSLDLLCKELKAQLHDDASVTATLEEIALFLRRDSLEQKLLREFGSTDPFTPRRFDYRKSYFEAWAPLGLLVHIAPGNAISVGVLSVVEGLLSGNINVLKLSSSDTNFPILFLEQLVASDVSGALQNFIYALKISSKEDDLMQMLMRDAAGIAVWGGEDAVASIKRKASKGTKVIEWGHRLSFAYLSSGVLSSSLMNQALKSLAKDICLLEQQACSSPQCIFLDVDAESSQLQDFAHKLSEVLGVESARLGAPSIDIAEAAEISMVTAVKQCEAALGFGDVIEASDRSWRVLVDKRSALRASPLYRSIWVMPLPQQEIFKTLWPMREFLQTSGLSCLPSELANLSAKLVASGVLRITELGRMLESYEGEPHDGVYALTRYTRRVSYQFPTIGQGYASFSELQHIRQSPPWGAMENAPQVMGKEEFQSQEIPVEKSELFFKSGGSSGEPKISIFTYRDYHTQMQLAAEGLIAAGFDPKQDRCMNLFFGGGLYGGFLSFFTILEHLRAVQFPMSAHMEFAFVGDMILRHQVNTLLGMPSYLVQLFEAPVNQQRFKKSRMIKKILYGGEHFSTPQREYFQREFGVELIRSATYGSVDSGPLGYQCIRSEGTVHHLHHRLQMLEILQLERDAPVETSSQLGEVGRLVFTSLARHGQKLHRYDIGDLGRWIIGDCACGRKSPRFELLGRYGDIFRCAGAFFNFQKISNIIRDVFAYAGELQVVIDHSHVKSSKESPQIDRLKVMVDATGHKKVSEYRAALIQQYQELHELVDLERSLILEVVEISIEEFKRTPGSGKLIRVIDNRSH